MTRYFFLLFLFVASQPFCFGCDCSRIADLKKSRVVSFEESELVFIAKVVSTGESEKLKSKGWFNNKIFELEVTENFKGTRTGQIVNGRALTSCSGYPDSGIWLIYGNYDSEGFLNYSICGLSRSFYKPQLISYEEYTPRPPTLEELKNPQPDDDLDWSIEMANIKLSAAIDLKEEVHWLRTQK